MADKLRGEQRARELMELTLDAHKTGDLGPLQLLTSAFDDDPEFAAYVGFMIAELALVAARAIQDAERRSLHNSRQLLARFCSTPIDGRTADIE